MRIPFRLAIGILAILSLTIGWGVLESRSLEAAGHVYEATQEGFSFCTSFEE